MELLTSLDIWVKTSLDEGRQIEGPEQKKLVETEKWDNCQGFLSYAYMPERHFEILAS